MFADSGRLTSAFLIPAPSPAIPINAGSLAAMRKLAIVLAVVWSAAAAWAGGGPILELHAQILDDSVYANIVVYTATRADQLANEHPTLGGGHGLFTLALVEGVQGKAKSAGDEVRAEGLKGYVQDRVKALVAQLKVSTQEPQYYKGRDAENYLLALAH